MCPSRPRGGAPLIREAIMTAQRWQMVGPGRACEHRALSRARCSSSASHSHLLPSHAKATRHQYRHARNRHQQRLVRHHPADRVSVDRSLAAGEARDPSRRRNRHLLPRDHSRPSARAKEGGRNLSTFNTSTKRHHLQPTRRPAANRLQTPGRAFWALTPLASLTLPRPRR